MSDAPTTPPTDTPKPPADLFTTRTGKSIALKAWTFQTLSEYGVDIQQFIDAFANTTLGQSGATFEAVKRVLPALKASVQDESALEHITGLGDMISFIDAVWEYNEIGAGLGKSVALQAKMQGIILTNSGGILSAS